MIRIDNPTADQIKPGDVLHFKPVKAVLLIMNNTVIADNEGGYPVDGIAYLEREEPKVGIGDTVTWGECRTDFIVCGIDGNELWVKGSDGLRTEASMAHRNFRIVKSASQS